jgi:hypothetical protein
LRLSGRVKSEREGGIVNGDPLNICARFVAETDADPFLSNAASRFEAEAERIMVPQKRLPEVTAEMFVTLTLSIADQMRDGDARAEYLYALRKASGRALAEAESKTRSENA